MDSELSFGGVVLLMLFFTYVKRDAIMVFLKEKGWIK